jgi:hypothetical protein
MTRDVGVGQLVKGLEQRGDRLPFEIGAFVALEACEGLLQESVKLEADDVRVTLEGSVIVSKAAERAEPDEAARSLVSVLAQLLVAAGPGVPPYLLQLVKESTTGQTPRNLRTLHDAIEASLIPINRGASRRVLARLVRESDRPPALEVPQVEPHELDAELDELLRDPVSRTLEPARAKAPVQEDEEEEPITERIRIPRRVTEEARPGDEVALRGDTGTGIDAAAGTDAAAAADTDTAAATDMKPVSFRPPVPDVEPAPAPAAAVAAIPEQPTSTALEPITATIRKWSRQEDTSHPPVTEFATESVTESATATASATPYDRPSLPAPLPRRGAWGVWLFAAALGIGVYALIATGTLDALLPPRAPAPALEPAPGGVIDVTVTPPDAQIFVFVGRGPAVVENLPVAGAHEFIVFDRGLHPSRAIVPEGATWSRTDQGLLYELAVQAQAVAAPLDALDFGSPQTEPASAEAGELGSVRVVTNPLGAKVYRFVGFGPTVQIPAASIHEGQEVLVYHPEHETRRAVIGPSDWQAGEGQSDHSASLEVQLPALPVSSVPETSQN